MRRPPDIINLPVPLPTENPQHSEQPHFPWRKSVKTPRESIAPETLRMRKKNPTTITEEDVGCFLYYSCNFYVK